MKAHTLAIALSLFTVQIIVAQSPLSVLENRLCKTWKLDRTIQGDKTSSTDKALSDFVMILNPDHTAKQGMIPDGLIGGKWTVDEKTMMLTIKDDATNQEYKMKITSLTTDELVLQDSSSNPVSYIHYHAK